MKKTFCLLIILLIASFVHSEVSHSTMSGTSVHTPYRWVFADSSARVGQSVTSADTLKLALQKSDSTTWVLVSITGTKWKKISFAQNQNLLTTSSVVYDSVFSTRGIATGKRITGTDIQVSDSIIGVTGTFSGVNKSDSVFSTKGINSNARITGTDVAVNDSVAAPRGVFDSIKLGSGDWLSTYDTGTVSMTATGWNTGGVPVKYTNIGALVILTVPIIPKTVSTTDLSIGTLPANLRPASNREYIVFGVDNSVSCAVRATVKTDGVITFAPIPNGTWDASSSKTLYGCCITYSIK
jgi:hypothetical protein